MSERASTPTFVPRTVTSFERAASRVAQRLYAPARQMARRALSLTERVIASWATESATAGAFGAGRSPLRLAERASGRVALLPWYELDAGEELAAQATAGASFAEETARDRPTAADRGAATARTVLDMVERAQGPEARAQRVLADEVTAPTAQPSARAATREIVAAAGGARAVALTPRPVSIAGRALKHLSWVDSSSRIIAERAERQGTTATSGLVLVQQQSMARDDATTPTGSRPASSTGTRAGAGMRADAGTGAETGTGANAVTSARADAAAGTDPPTRTRADAAASTDATRTHAAAGTDATTRTGAAGTDAATRTLTDAIPPSGTRADSRTKTDPRTGTGMASGASLIAAANVNLVSPPSLAWTPGLPDLRLSAVLPGRVAHEVAELVARLVGVGAARDATPFAPGSAATKPDARSLRAPEPTWLATVERDSASPEPNSFRPGATAARVEHAAATVGARASALWGHPVGKTPAAAVTSSSTAATPLTVAPPSPMVSASTFGAVWTDSAPTSGDHGTARRPGAQAPPASNRVAASAPSSVWTWDAPSPRAARGPAQMARFVDDLVGVRAVATTAPLPLPFAEFTNDDTAGPRREQATAPTFALGGLARAAEQLGGVVGVRAAGLSIDFVDPARLSLFGAAAPAMPNVSLPVGDAPAVALGETPPAETAQTSMPRARPLFAAPTLTPRAPTLTAEEWALVATFPSVATAVQMAAARQASEWRGGASGRFAGDLARPLIAFAAPARAEATRELAAATTSAPLAAMAGAPVAATTAAPAAATTSARAGGRDGARAWTATEYVGASAAAVGTRLPSGRAPRGGFIWPRVAELTMGAPEWSPPATIALAEHVKHQAPGMTLWEAMPGALDAAVAPGFEEARDEARSAAGSSSEPPPSSSISARVVTSTSSTAPGSAPPSSRVEASPSMTLLSATAQRSARARAGERADVSDGDARAPANEPRVGEARGARADVKMPTLLPPSMPSTIGGPAMTGAKARALELARPFLRLVEGGIASDEGRPSAPRFFDQPQPLVSAVPSSDAASRIVDATRSRPQTSANDERMTLADLTLIAMASATQQVAASPEGGSGADHPPPPAAAPAGAAGGQHAAAASGNLHQDIEELARAAFAELLRVQELERERSGNGW